MIGQKGLWTTRGGGGVERHVAELAPRLVGLGFEVVVYARRKYCRPVCPPSTGGVRLIYLPTIYTKHLEAIVHTIFSTLHALWLRPDVYHFHGVGPALVSWMPRLFHPRALVVVTFHAQDQFHQKWGWIARRILRAGEWMACHVPHATITVSHALTVFVRKTYGRKPVYIPNGATPKTVTTFGRVLALGLTPHQYLLTVGRLLPVKGIHDLLRAFRPLKTDRHLAIVGVSGDDAYVAQLKKLAQGDRRIVFLGYQGGRTLEELYANAAVFVQPSTSEGLPLAVLEAIGYGAPVLVSDIPGNREAMHGVGFTFEAGNVSVLSETLSELLRHTERTQASGREGQHQLRAWASWDTVAERTADVYRSLHLYVASS